MGGVTAFGLAGFTDADARCSALSMVNGEASAEIPIGVMVTRLDGQRCRLLTSAADDLVGVTCIVRKPGQQWLAPYAATFEFGAVGVKPHVMLAVLTSGTLWVTSETAVTPRSPVWVRAVATGDEVAGAFRGSQDGADCIDCTGFAKWETSAPAGGAARLAIKMVTARI